MGFFTPPPRVAYNAANSQMVSHPELNRRRSPTRKSSDEEPSENSANEPDSETTTSETAETSETLAPKEKKIIKTRNRERFDPQTSKNTHLNSLIYHTSEDTIDLYAKENNSSDLLGRLYYDDFDSEALTPIVSVNTTPLLSPSGSVIGTDYFSLRPSGALSPSGSGVASKSASYTNLRKIPTSGSSEEKRKKYGRGISFDTSTNIERISLTLKVKHPKFRFRRNNKTFLAGFSDDIESNKAIEWLLDEMIINGDTVVILQVLDEKLHHDIDKIKCNENLEMFQELNVHNKKIAIVYEIVIGKPQKLLRKAIDEYTPQMMIMGLHADDRDQHKSIFTKTTVSKYFLQYALVPVIVVKHTYDNVETLQTPIEGEDHFKDWIAGIDISDTFYKEKDKKKKRIKSPLGLRSSSLLSLPGLAEERGRTREDEHRRLLSGSRSPSASRSIDQRSDSRSSQKRSTLSKLFHHR